MKLSARNNFKGKIVELTKGSVNTEIVIELPSKERIVSIVTNNSVGNLGLSVGKEAYAIIKASSVIVGVD